MTDSSIVLVTGAGGAVGPALVERLLREGHRVRVLSRHPTRTGWQGPIEVHAGDVADCAAVERAMAGVRTVFHLAALLHVARPTPEQATESERVNVEGTRVVAAAAARARAEALVFFSTISVYGATAPNAEADEDMAPRADGLYAATKLAGERIVLERHGKDGLSSTVLRLAAVYGPHVKANYARLAAALRAGWFLPVGRGTNRRTLVHEADVAEAAVLAATNPKAGGRIYNVSDGEVHELNEVVGAICRALGRRPPRWRVPLSLARNVARLGDLGLAGLGRSGRLLSLVDKYTEDVAVRADRIQQELGFRARFDLDSGWRHAL